jgi:hypothetical protein
MKRLFQLSELLALVILALIMSMCFGDNDAFASSLTQNKTFAWDQRQADLQIPTGSTVRPLNKWIMQFRDTPTGAVVNTLDFPYDASKLSGPVSGNMTYITDPIAITATGIGGTTVQKCMTVTAYGNHTPPPPKETAPSNQVCLDFALPADPVPAPGPPTSLQMRNPTP